MQFARQTIRALVVLAAAAAILAVGAASALALPPSFDTIVNAPADGGRYFGGVDLPPSTLSFSGAATGGTWSPGDLIELRCYSHATAGSWMVIQSGVALDGSGNFSVPDVPMTNLVSNDCLVIAVPVGLTPSIPNPSYVGPHLIFDDKTTYNDPPYTNYSFNDFAGQSAGSFQYNSAADCGGYSWLRDPANGLFATYAFDCAGSLGDSYQATASDPLISSVRVNGANSFMANTLYSGNAAGSGGFPSLTNDFSIDSATGDATLVERAGIASCPSNTATPNAGDCATATDTGVKLTRTIHQNRNGQSSFFSDVFSNTTAAPVTLSLAYGSRFCSGWTCPWTNIVTSFPGKPDYVDPAQYTAVSGPIPASSSFYTHDSSVPDGSTAAARVATTIFPAADDAIFDNPIAVILRYTNRQIPPGGSFTVNQEFSQAFSQAQLQQLTTAAAGDVTPKPTFAAAGKTKTTYNKRKKRVTVTTGRQVECPAYGQTCTITVSMKTKVNSKTGKSAAPARAKWKTYTIGTATLSAAAGGATPVSVTLSKKGTALLKKLKQLNATLKIGVSAGPYASASESVRLRFKMPKVPKRR